MTTTMDYNLGQPLKRAVAPLRREKSRRVLQVQQKQREQQKSVDEAECPIVGCVRLSARSFASSPDLRGDEGV
jgi:hypothetical protein